MKLGRMVYDDKISVPFEDEINRSVEEHTLPKRMVKKGENKEKTLAFMLFRINS